MVRLISFVDLCNLLFFSLLMGGVLPPYFQIMKRYFCLIPFFVFLLIFSLFIRFSIDDVSAAEIPDGLLNAPTTYHAETYENGTLKYKYDFSVISGHGFILPFNQAGSPTFWYLGTPDFSFRQVMTFPNGDVLSDSTFNFSSVSGRLSYNGYYFRILSQSSIYFDFDNLSFTLRPYDKNYSYTSSEIIDIIKEFIDAYFWNGIDWEIGTPDEDSIGYLNNVVVRPLDIGNSPDQGTGNSSNDIFISVTYDRYTSTGFDLLSDGATVYVNGLMEQNVEKLIGNPVKHIWQTEWFDTLTNQTYYNNSNNQAYSNYITKVYLNPWWIVQNSTIYKGYPEFNGLGFAGVLDVEYKLCPYDSSTGSKGGITYISYDSNDTTGDKWRIGKGRMPWISDPDNPGQYIPGDPSDPDYDDVPIGIGPTPGDGEDDSDDKLRDPDDGLLPWLPDIGDGDWKSIIKSLENALGSFVGAIQSFVSLVSSVLSFLPKWVKDFFAISVTIWCIMLIKRAIF